MMLLNKDAILSAQDLKTEHVLVPEWGGKVIVSEMGGLTAMEFYDALWPEGDEDGKAKSIDSTFMATAIIHSVVDEQGARLFSMDDLPRLARKKGKALRRVFEAADRLNLLTNKAREEAAKNLSGEAAGEETCSSSPESSDSLPSGTSAAS